LYSQQEKTIFFFQDGRFNASTDVFNENRRCAEFSETINGKTVDYMCIFPNNDIYVKLDDDCDTIDSKMFIFGKVNVIHEAYNYDTMIVTFQKDNGLDNDEHQNLVFIAPES